MDATREERKTSGTSTKNLPSVLKHLLWLGKVTALAPVVVYEDASGSYAVKSTTSNVIYSYLLIGVVHVFSAISSVYLYTGYTVLTPFSIDYLYARAVITFLIHINFLRHRRIVEAALVATLRFQFGLPLKFLAVPVLAIFTSCSVALINNVYRVRSRTRLILSVPLDSIPAVITITTCALFACQVEAMVKASIELNKEILEMLSTDRVPPLRGVMKKLNHLHNVCSALNDSYGMPMLLAIALVFLETIVSVTEIAETLVTLNKFCCPIWMLSHVIPSFWVMHICQNVEEESKQTQSLTMNMRTLLSNHDLERSTQLEILEWDLQLRHQSLRFYACGCLQLNGNQIMTITATSISYVVILIQNVRLRNATVNFV